MAEPAPHFIGWLPMPREYARFLAPVAAGLVLVAVVTAGLIARGQRSPGDARWEDSRPVTLVGIAYADPYAMIRVPGNAPGDPPVSILLVEDGKFGATDRVRPYDGRPVRVTGTLLHRDGLRMLELASTEDGIGSVDPPESELVGLRRLPPRAHGRMTLRGEIVDSKCYLGAMKPGGGRTHRGCALLCLRGGVPPLFVSRAGDGRWSIYLLASESHGPAPDSLLNLVGLPVVVEGFAETLDDLSVLRVAPHDAHIE